MPKTEGDPLGPFFGWRLRAELDRIQPPDSPPRYLSRQGRRIVAWRLAPAVLAVGLTGILGLTAWAATGSTDPAVWTHRVVTVIRPEAPSPTPESSPTPPQSEAAPPSAVPEPAASSEPTERPEPSANPQPSESPEPSDDHSTSPTASPTPEDH